MFLIVGLGNPDKRYFNTYHNVGFLTVDKIAQKLNVKFAKSFCYADVAEAKISNQKVLIAKPKTYMNLSGESVKAFKKKFNLKNSEILVVVDDVDLPLGAYRFREAGSAGTHNGMRSIVQNIGVDFKRVRIGIKPEEKPYNLADYVLSEIDDETMNVLNDVMDVSSDFIINLIGKE